MKNHRHTSACQPERRLFALWQLCIVHRTMVFLANEKSIFEFFTQPKFSLSSEPPNYPSSIFTSQIGSQSQEISITSQTLQKGTWAYLRVSQTLQKAREPTCGYRELRPQLGYILPPQNPFSIILTTLSHQMDNLFDQLAGGITGDVAENMEDNGGLSVSLLSTYKNVRVALTTAVGFAVWNRGRDVRDRCSRCLGMLLIWSLLSYKPFLCLNFEPFPCRAITAEVAETATLEEEEVLEEEVFKETKSWFPSSLVVVKIHRFFIKI